MGCDGGTIPRRDELVRLKKKPEQKDKDSELVFKWRYCSLTQQPLQKPIVACGLGRLYNKQSVIEGLLSKSLPETLNHIKNLKDLKNLNLTPNPAFNSNEDKTDGMLDRRSVPYICPIIGLEMAGRFRFVFLWSCGCVFSERARKEIKTNNCVMCQQPFTELDVVILNGADEDLDQMTANMIQRKVQHKLKDDKKSKKSKKNLPETQTSCTAAADEKIVEKPPQPEGVAGTSAAEVKPPSDEVAPKLKTTVVKSLNTNKRPTDLKPTDDPVFKKAKIDYSVAKDPRATEVFKSLFTSHRTERQQDRAHWVTYNPFYN